MNTPADIQIPCPAKLNLTLAVGPPRDDGLHPLASVMLPLALHDDLILRRLDSGTSRFQREVTSDCPRPFEIDWPIEKDLAYRAHQLVEQHCGQALPIDCSIRKTIPTGAGLGGGSSNAGAMLAGLRELFDLALADDDLIRLGQRLGSDVAFAVHSALHHQAAIVTGIGEVLKPLPTLPPFHTTLLFPEGRCATAEVYSQIDTLGQFTEPDKLSTLAESWQNGRALPTPTNDLHPAAMEVCPAIGHAIETMADLGYDAHLTGSGATLFVLAEDEAHALSIVEHARGANLMACASTFAPQANL